MIKMLRQTIGVLILFMAMCTAIVFPVVSGFTSDNEVNSKETQKLTDSPDVQSVDEQTKFSE